MIVCPKCAAQYATVDDLDCIGACNDNLFCTQCHCEFDPETSEIHECDTDTMEAAINRERGIICVGRRRQAR